MFYSFSISPTDSKRVVGPIEFLMQEMDGCHLKVGLGKIETFLFILLASSSLYSHRAAFQLTWVLLC